MKRSIGLFLLAVSALAVEPVSRHGGELRFCLRAEPKTFHPLQVADEPSETIRYLTGGVLIRVNRQTQQMQPELAVSWKIKNRGRAISFKLRQGLSFSDGTPFSATDIAYTVRALMDPKLHSPTGDSFRSGTGDVSVEVSGKDRVTVTFPSPVAGMERLFDQVAIMSSRSPKKELAVLGPFFVAHRKPGLEVLLQRNPYYWKRDSSGRQLPYLDSVRLLIQQNREIESVRFRRGELHLINNLEPELYERLAKQSPGSVQDLGPSLDSEMIFFNQVPAAPIPAYKKAWFASKTFRRAVSAAINRDDLCRIVYQGHARPAAGPFSSANKFWANARLKPHPFDPATARKALEQDGFRLKAGLLRDRQGRSVEFSIITNAGNKSRERIAAMVQQDLKKIGIRLNVVTLDFPSIIERITKNFRYEACLLGLVNVDLDPNAQMNVWLSSSSNHQWNPGQKTPATAWEAEIDRLMRAQASVMDRKKRKTYFDKVQEIAWEEAPFLYLVHKNALVAVAPSVRNLAPAVLRPQAYWNAESLSLGSPGAASP